MKQWILCIALFGAFSCNGQSGGLSDKDKIYGLSEAWRIAKEHFAHFDKVTVDWDSLYRENISNVLNTDDFRAYYSILIEMYAQLNDGHSWIWYPDSITNMLDIIPVYTELIDEKVIVSEVWDEKLKEIAPGDELLEIDGIPALEYGRTKIEPIVSASTPQDKVLRTYSYDLFLGDYDKPVELTIKKHATKKIFKLKIKRGLEKEIPYTSFEFRVLEGNIGYLKINSFYISNYQELFLKAYPDMMKTGALIIDVRENGGGSSLQGYHVLSHILEKPALTAAWKTRKLEGGWEVHQPDTISPTEDLAVYTKPVAVLIGPGTFSAAEDFCMVFDYAKRGVLVGSCTGGSTGNSIEFELPGGGSGQVCSKRDTYPDGKEFVGIGICPDIEVKRSVDDLVEKNDPVLKKAIGELRRIEYQR